MLNINDTTIICIDIQEKLAGIASESVIKNTVKLMKTAGILNINTIVTEQYPKGLGETIPEIKSIKDFKTIEKTTFSAYQTPEFKNEFDKLNNKNVLIFGIETHICVSQTANVLAEAGFDVNVIVDACGSRFEKEHIAEVQASSWEEKTELELKEMQIL